MSAWLDALARDVGRTPAEVATVERMVRRGAIVEVEVEPGAVAALVQPPRGQGLRARVGVRRFAEEDWAELVRGYAASSRALTDLLAGALPDLPPDAVPPVLPRARDLAFDCPCGGYQEPCGHALAVCAALDALLAEDPLAALVLRGRDRTEVIEAVRSAAAVLTAPEEHPGADTPAVEPLHTAGVPSAIPGRPADPGVAASKALRTPLAPPPDPQPAHRPVHTAVPAVVPPAGSGVEGGALTALALDAADRARALLTGEAAAGAAGLDEVADAVRRCATARHGTRPDPEQVAARLGLDAAGFSALVAAWRTGGAPAVEVLRTPRRPRPGEVEAVAAAYERSLGEAPAPGTVVARSTGIRCGDGQLRRSTDGTWVRLAADDELGWRIVAVSAELDDVL